MRFVCLFLFSFCFFTARASCVHHTTEAGMDLAVSAKHGQFTYTSDTKELIEWAKGSSACRSLAKDPCHLTEEERDEIQSAVVSIISDAAKSGSFLTKLYGSGLDSETTDMILVLTCGFLDLS